MLDLETRSWKTVEPAIELPRGLTVRAAWSGEEFLFWGGAVETEAGERAQNMGGVFYNPVTEQWRLLEGPIPPGEFPLGWEWGRWSGIQSAQGFHLWGSFPSSKEPMFFFLDWETEEWTSLASAGGPSVRVDFSMFRGDDEVFLIGGREPDDDNRLREIWRYSLTNDEWNEIEVPNFVDPLRAIVFGDHMYVFGDCHADARYNLKTGSWETLPALPEVRSTASVVGDKLLVGGMQDHFVNPYPYMLVYAPDGAASLGDGGAAGGTN